MVDIEKRSLRAFEKDVSIFEGALRLLSPFMPFITEEIWHAIYDGKPPLESIVFSASGPPSGLEAIT